MRVTFLRYEFDLVVMHDKTIPQAALDTIHGLGARTLFLSDTIKHLSCLGYIKLNREGLDEKRCEMPYDGDHHILRARLTMLVQQLKLGAATLLDYKNTVQIDIDLLLRDIGFLEVELDYMRQNENIDLVSSSRVVPVSASHFAMRPSLSTVDLWLKDLKHGFNPDPKIGWSDDENHLPATITMDGVERERSWKFIGSDRDQGLLAHLFQVVRQSFCSVQYFDGVAPKLHKLKTMEPEWQKKYNAYSGTRGRVHSFGRSDKPWGADTCLVASRLPCNKLKERILYLDASEVRSYAAIAKSNKFLEYCAAVFKTNLHNCQALNAKMCQ